MCMRQICDDLVQVVCVEQVDVNGNWVMKLCVGTSIQVCCDVSPLPRNLAEFEFPRTALLRQVGLLHVRALDRAVFRLCTACAGSLVAADVWSSMWCADLKVMVKGELSFAKHCLHTM